MLRSVMMRLAALLLGAFVAAPTLGQQAFEGTLCTFDAQPLPPSLFVFPADDEATDTVRRLADRLAVRVPFELLSANVPTVAVGRSRAGRPHVLYNTIFLEALHRNEPEALAVITHLVYGLEQLEVVARAGRCPDEGDAFAIATGRYLAYLGAGWGEIARSLEAAETRFADPTRLQAMRAGWADAHGSEQNGETAAPDPPAAPAPSPPPTAGPPPMPPPAGHGFEGSDDFPQFEWPPPRASASAALSLAPVREAETSATLGDVADWLERGLNETGYGERSYFAVPEGFALVAQLERIRPDGTPLEGDERWQLRVRPMQRFSLRAYLRALFRAAPGHYRIIAFIVTPRPFSQSGELASVEEARAWLSEGANALPVELAAQPLGPGVRCTALVYEFERPTENHDPEIKQPSTLTGRRHLERARLLESLGQ